MNIIELAKEAGLLDDDEAWVSPHQEAMERFAALVRAEDDPDIQYSQGYLDGASAGKLEGRAEREWVDLTDDEKVVLSDRLNLDRRIVVMDAVIAAFKEKNK